jgi:hypothetical protein
MLKMPCRLVEEEA